MMLVRTTVRPSPIHGLGIFAEEFIPAGTAIWRFTPGFDLTFSKEQLESFPQLLQEYLATYAWFSAKSGHYVFASDNAKYFNHSPTPNSLSAYYEGEEEVVTKAVRDIQIGEEIMDDYSTYGTVAISAHG
jgi:SET domain-containing protein